ncbi:hypothetical protein MTO96_029837 [Rhipicephalus appendiculatus]
MGAEGKGGCIATSTNRGLLQRRRNADIRSRFQRFAQARCTVPRYTSASRRRGRRRREGRLTCRPARPCPRETSAPEHGETMRSGADAAHRRSKMAQHRSVPPQHPVSHRSFSYPLPTLPDPPPGKERVQRSKPLYTLCRRRIFAREP